MTDTDIYLDEDGDYVVEDGDLKLIEDFDVLVQDVRHRIITMKGSLPADAKYGASLPLYLHGVNLPIYRRDLANRLGRELAKETRLEPRGTKILIAPRDNELFVNVEFIRKSDWTSGRAEIRL